MTDFVWYLVEDDKLLITNGIGKWSESGYRMLPINSEHNEFRLIKDSRIIFIGAL